MRAVDRQLGEIRAAEAGELGVEVGEQPGLHQRVVGDLDARHQVAGVEGDLLGLGEVVGGVAVQRQLADQLHRREFLGHELGRVEQVDALEAVGAVVGHHLNAELVLEERAGLDPVGHVAAVEVRIAAGGDLRFLPHQGVHAGDRLPVELDQARLAGGVDEPEGVHAESLHGPEGAGDTAVAHVPQHVMRRLGVQRHEVPERVVRGLRLRDLAIRVRLGGVDDVGELDAVLNEEHRHVVADQVEGALVGVELHREPAGVADGVGRPSGPEHGRKAGEDVGFRALLAEEPGLGDRRRGAVGLEHAVRGGTAGVHHPLRDALMVEVGDLLPQVEVLQQRGARGAGLERVIGVRQAQTLGRGQKLTGLGPWIRVGALAVRDAGRAG